MSPFRKLGIVYGNFLFRYRNYIFPLVLLVIVIATRPGTGTAEIITTSLGIGVALFGQLIRAAVIGLDYIKRGGLNKQVAAEHLVTSGIFAHCRNPLYVGNLLILCGLLILYGNLWAALAGVVFFFGSYSAIIAAEEEFLAGKFSNEYVEYCKQVPRWLFRLPGLHTTLTGNMFNWRRVIAKDYTTATTWLISMVLLLIDKAWHENPGTAYTVIVTAAVAILAILTAAYCIKLLKKSGYFTGI